MTRLLGGILGDEEVDAGELRPLRADKREFADGDEVWLRRKGEIMEVEAEAEVEVEERKGESELEFGLPAPESSGGGGG